jgi:hypothetical protein
MILAAIRLDAPAAKVARAADKAKTIDAVSRLAVPEASCGLPSR